MYPQQDSMQIGIRSEYDATVCRTQLAFEGIDVVWVRNRVAEHRHQPGIVAGHPVKVERWLHMMARTNFDAAPQRLLHPIAIDQRQDLPVMAVHQPGA